MSLRVLGISCSPRPGGNTDAILRRVLELFSGYGCETVFVALRDLRIQHCSSCRKCLDTGRCVIEDDMHRLASEMLRSDVIVIASPVHFDNVSSLAKVFMDRTWWLRGRLKLKVGLAIVVGRGYGLDSAISAIHNFMLKHGMILCHRGVRCRAFERGEALRDSQALRDAEDAVRSVITVALAVKKGLSSRATVIPPPRTPSSPP